MSWSPDLYIGELRPWPDSVRVVRGNTDEVRRYMPEHKDGQEALCARIDELCAEVERLRKAKDTMHGDAFEIGAMLVKARDENANLREQVSMWRACREDEAKRCDRADAEVERLSAENAKLREQLAKARDPQRIGGTADPESFVYAIEQLREFRWQHATNDEEAIPYINNVADAHERENAKLRDENAELRKLGGFMLRCISQYHDCADCLVNGEHCEISYIESDARELGIEVPS